MKELGKFLDTKYGPFTFHTWSILTGWLIIVLAGIS